MNEAPTLILRYSVPATALARLFTLLVDEGGGGELCPGAVAWRPQALGCSLEQLISLMDFIPGCTFESLGKLLKYLVPLNALGLAPNQLNQNPSCRAPGISVF